MPHSHNVVKVVSCYFKLSWRPPKFLDDVERSQAAPLQFTAFAGRKNRQLQFQSGLASTCKPGSDLSRQWNDSFFLISMAAFSWVTQMSLGSGMHMHTPSVSLPPTQPLCTALGIGNPRYATGVKSCFPDAIELQLPQSLTIVHIGQHCMELETNICLII